MIVYMRFLPNCFLRLFKLTHILYFVHAIAQEVLQIPWKMAWLQLLKYCGEFLIQSYIIADMISGTGLKNLVVAL